MADQVAHMRGVGGRLFEMIWSDATIWINADDGMCVGRFSRFGVDVHHDAETQLWTGAQCLACVHDAPPDEGWEIFLEKMWRHYELEIPGDIRPAFADPIIADEAPSP